ncbi:hypothetical protein K4K49_012182 [Colletotrichum sp. SAR 10_70]|nr:hypothetical protein K4K50_011579 [Colletotrichum sp. SAR 10_71]KAI8190522.1 hypothetical protein K4K49_012182 [Colletotrichum sp. SAR 10_70]
MSMILKPSLVLLLAAGAFGFPAVGKEYSNSSHPTSPCVKCVLPEPPVTPPCPTGDAGPNRFGLSGQQTATFAENGPIATLSPNVHWSCDTAPASNVIPIPANEGSQMYYGVGDPSKPGGFAFMTYWFSAPSVNLDHCDHVASMEYTAGALTIVFASEEAYRHAVDTWATDGGLILLAFIKGCGDHSKGERCYFVVSELDFGPPGYVVRANGKSRHPDEIATSGSATWDGEGFFKKRHNQHRKRQAGLIKAAANIAKKAYQTVQFATTLSGTINREFVWKLPDPLSGNADAKRVQDREAKQMRSPWGDAVLLRRFSSSVRGNGGSAKEFMDVYCVGCGVTGNAKVAGSAKWTPGEGIVEGQVEIRTDVMFVLKVGIDAGIVLKQNFKAELFSLGLPGLSFGVVSIGPRITVGTSVTLEAAAKGRLLAGAEMGLEDARVVLDFVNDSKATDRGWEPYFKPVFEADGSLMVSSTLGLPIAIKCGIKVSTFSRDVGVISEPSIKGVAQVAASIGNSAGVLEGGFTSRDGCPGIAGQITWRHKLYAEIPGRKPIPLLDTKDRPLARTCLPDLQPTGDVVDETTSVAGSTDLDYTSQPVGTNPYMDDTGREFGIITDSSNSSMIISCSNGNMYPVSIGSPENAVCSELWAAAQDVLIYDGAERLMHYYTNTMSVLGVSRLRVGPEFVAPAGAAVVTWAVYTAPDGTNDSYYVAVDSHDGLFYPIICDYSDGTASRLFLAKDPVAGVTLLESADVMYSVTGGQVSTCQTVALGLRTRQG